VFDEMCEGRRPRGCCSCMKGDFAQVTAVLVYKSNPSLQINI
jgi:hypothetical protein